MIVSRTTAALAAMIVAASAFASGTQTADASNAVEATGRPLTRGELAALFRNRTWLWKDGGGYFQRSGRFVARTGAGRKRTGMRGGWGAYRGGKICFSGTWTSPASQRWAGRPEWNAFRSTCFRLRKVRSKIYQRRLPVGEWFVFRHSPMRRTDEYRKLAPGNHANWYRIWHRRRATRSR